MNKLSKQDKGMKIYIEGNIGSGKTTFINLLKSEYHLGVDFVYEPIKEWLDFKDTDGKNILEHFYSDQEKNGFMFQMNAFITRTKAIQKAVDKKFYEDSETTLLIERSVYTDRYCFAKNLYETNKLSEIEWKLYCKWFNLLTVDYNIIPDGFIYLRTPPEISYRRIQERARSEEMGIELEYLTKLHNLHDSWLLSKTLGCPVLVLDVTEDFEHNYLVFKSFTEKINNFFPIVKKYKTGRKSVKRSLINEYQLEF